MDNRKNSPVIDSSADSKAHSALALACFSGNEVLVKTLINAGISDETLADASLAFRTLINDEYIKKDKTVPQNMKRCAVALKLEIDKRKAKAAEPKPLYPTRSNTTVDKLKKLFNIELSEDFKLGTSAAANTSSSTVNHLLTPIEDFLLIERASIPGSFFGYVPSQSTFGHDSSQNQCALQQNTNKR